jgi:hypothetical protein
VGSSSRSSAPAGHPQQRERDVLSGGQVLEQVEALEDHAHPLPQLDPPRPVQAVAVLGHHLAVDLDDPFGGFL